MISNLFADIAAAGILPADGAIVARQRGFVNVPRPYCVPHLP
ncbi:hypothetical protein RCH23_000302 [Cryobacterium sp. CAN_C3]|nr:hypothetical protein [Cryobacterium sp. CAN_C3]